MTDFQNTTVFINGINQAVEAKYEYTSYDVGLAYNQYIQVIGDIFKREATVDGTGVTALAPVTTADAAAVWTALNNLFHLAKQGINGAPLNTEMARNLDELSRSFSAVGFDLPSGNLNALPPTGAALDALTEALKAWKDLSALSPVISDIIVKGLNAFAANRSLQALIELEYVKTANDLVNDRLGSLEEALTNTNGILNTLAAIQNIHNLLTVTSKPSFNFDYSQPGGGYVASYQKAASEYFGKPINPIIPTDIVFASEYQSFVVLAGVTFNVEVNFSTLTPKGQSIFNQLIRLRASIIAEIAKLSEILSPTQRLATGSLYSQLKTVLSDFDTNFTIGVGGLPITTSVGLTEIQKRGALSRWLIDKYNKPDDSSSGAIQANITKAITAAQSLNDTQKEDVRNYMFVFEEYYKSASAVLQKITQILERIAQGVRS
jgi:hypothetical protein